MILDATAGYRMMWFNKDYAGCIYIDKRKEVKPTVCCSWNKLPFPNDIFELIIFDPPHTNPGETGKGELYKNYGALRAGKMVPTLYYATRELLRVLKPNGYLIFKWNTHKKGLNKILQLFPIQPLFGQKTAYKTKHSSSTYWVLFRKEQRQFTFREVTGQTQFLEA